MNRTPHNSQKSPSSHKSDVELFRIRLKTRLCIALLCMIQLIPRIAIVLGSAVGSSVGPTTMLLVSIPFAPTMSIIIGIEYLLFKKRGSGVLKYSQVVDIIVLLLFMADWIAILMDAFGHTLKTNPPSLSMNALYGFTSFAWRTLLVTLIVQKWQLKIIAPVVTLAVATGYAIHYDPGQTYPILFKSCTQIFNAIFVIYCDDKLKWKIIWTNLQQEKWMQVNNFILNNIPENIMILDLKGEIQFLSDYCKSFMEKFNLSLDSKDFLHKIRHLHLQRNDSSPSSNVEVEIERITTENELLGGAKSDSNNKEILEEVLKGFKKIIVEKSIQERQFLVYNGKLKLEENRQEKAIEIKISFIQHFENFYIILILRDTTQRDLLVTLEETNKYKDQLLASVSHELRAPLNGNINLVETAINSPKVSDDIKENLLVPALRSSKFLLHIINDILDMCQIKEKKLRLVFQPGDLRETLKSATQLVELQAKKKGIQVVLEFDPSLPTKICTDHIRLSQIVLNLLSNAMKFTKQGTVKLLAIPMMNQQHQWVKIVVEDSGIGISQENMKKLFSNYTHIEFEGRQIMNSAGVGLGLNIAYQLVQLLAPKGHQGIDVLSTPNKGSVFSFIIEDKEEVRPQSQDNFPDDWNRSRQTSEELTGDKKPMLFQKLKTLDTSDPDELLTGTCSCPDILIVDDNPFNTMAFETILSSLDIKCDPAYSGLSAIEKLLAREKKSCGKDCKQYSVIFMDQEMPEMSGSETVQEIRRLQKEKSLPQRVRIIGCTAHKSRVEVDKFLASGLDRCIHKPISVSMIKDILCEFCI